MRRHCCNGPWWHGKLKGFGYKITEGREAILEFLASSENHVSAEDIYKAIHSEYPNVGLTTIYRTLDILEKMSLVYCFDFGDGRARYELAEGPKGAHHHHHLVCTSCNRVIDYTDFIKEEVKLLTETEKGLSEKYNFRITNHLIQFYGVCDSCQVKKTV